MVKFENYVNKYKTIRMERRNGILQMQLHTNGKPCNGERLRTKNSAIVFRISALTPKIGPLL